MDKMVNFDDMHLFFYKSIMVLLIGCPKECMSQKTINIWKFSEIVFVNTDGQAHRLTAISSNVELRDTNE